jgi:hypothetical protein
MIEETLVDMVRRIVPEIEAKVQAIYDYGVAQHNRAERMSAEVDRLAALLARIRGRYWANMAQEILDEIDSILATPEQIAPKS